MSIEFESQLDDANAWQLQLFDVGPRHTAALCYERVRGLFMAFQGASELWGWEPWLFACRVDVGVFSANVDLLNF